MAKKDWRKEFKEEVVSPEGLKKLRERVAIEKKREDDGQWCSGVGLSSLQLEALIDRIEFLEDQLKYSDGE